ncbi:hypothetical protein CMV_000590 [Castanea mollissima]|uniref:Uncharacterized protein n=1 Tax=Castanea mollissima TaxID=60419 RepID=A0A8J4S3I4_9ROSI|nr:hypothetical protein CMV_000590 [Castanea mollissima]
MGMKLTALDFKSWLNRQRISGRMMTTVMMKNCNHPLMKWTLSFSLWIQSKNLTQTLDSHYQALANGVAQHAEQSRVEIEKERMEKEAATVAY